MNPNIEVSRWWETRSIIQIIEACLSLRRYHVLCVIGQANPRDPRKFSTSACCPASLILPIITWTEVGDSVSDLQLESSTKGSIYLSSFYRVRQRKYS